MDELRTMAARARAGDVEAALALRGFGRAALDVLIELLGHENATVREIAADSLVDVPDPRAFEPLMGVVQDRDEDPFVAKEACIALGEIGDRRAVRPLLDVIEAHRLDDGDYTGIVEYTAMALGQLGDESAVDSLAGLLSHESMVVRRRAGDALVKIATPEAIAAARTLLKDDDVRTLIADSLEAAGALLPEEIERLAPERERDRQRRWAESARAREILGLPPPDSP